MKTTTHLLTLVAVLCCAIITQGADARAAPDRVAHAATNRAAAIVRKMTRDEKLRYVHGFFPPYQKPLPAWMANAAGHVPGIPRLQIPALRESDASLGVANNVEQRAGDTATALPGTLALAASFDPVLARRAGAMIGSEARAKTFNVLLAGGVNLTRDAWGGRDFEYFGEDPLLSGVMAGAAVAGVQSNHIISTVKHFALNAQETGRDVLDAQTDHDALQESDLLAFRIAIEDGHPGSVMCAYNKVDGDYACENRWLLTDVLRRQWHYPGFVMSDWGGVHSTERAALAGLDQESGQELDSQIFFGDPLAAAVLAGRVPERRLDEMVTRVLTAEIASGLFDHPVPTTPQPINFAANAGVAQDVALRGIVLLKNARSVLPLSRAAKHIVLIDGHADVGVLSGGGSSQVRSVGGVPIELPLTEGTAMSFARVTWHASSPLRALRAAAPGVEIDYVDGSDAAAAASAAQNADVAIIFATQWRTEAQDLPDLSLSDRQDALITAVAKANPATVVVLETGGAVLMPWRDQVAGIIAAWYPGQRGGEALAKLLFGDADFAGRLPISFPRSMAQLPRPQPADPAHPIAYPERANVGYRWFLQQAAAPAFPFGFGLGYGTTIFRDVRFTGGAHPRVSVVLQNSGQRTATAVPQLYLVGPEQAPARLVGWRSTDLAPGETRRITIGADRRLLARQRDGHWVIATGAYRLILGTDAETAVAVGRVTVGLARHRSR